MTLKIDGTCCGIRLDDCLESIPEPITPQIKPPLETGMIEISYKVQLTLAKTQLIITKYFTTDLMSSIEGVEKLKLGAPIKSMLLSQAEQNQSYKVELACLNLQNPYFIITKKSFPPIIDGFGKSISTITNAIWTPESKQEYYEVLLEEIKEPITKIVNDYSLHISMIRQVDNSRARIWPGSCFIIDEIIGSMRFIDYSCECYLNFIPAPFSAYVKTFHTKLRTLSKEIVENVDLSANQKMLEDLQADVRNQLFSPDQTLECKKFFIEMLLAHLDRLQALYYAYSSSIEALQNFFPSLDIDRSEFFPSLLAKLFVQLVMDCDETMENQSGTCFAKLIDDLKRMVENAWRDLVSGGYMDDHLKAVEKFIKSHLLFT
jgi:hypothetical protein